MPGTSRDDQRLERRLRVGLRMVLYAALLGLVVAVWQQHRNAAAVPSAASPRSLVMWRGQTEQGGQVQARTIDGRLDMVRVALRYDCLDRPFYWSTWHRGARDDERAEDHSGTVGFGPVDLVVPGGVVMGTLETQVTFRRDAVLSGSAWSRVVLNRTDTGSPRLSPVPCGSGTVRFTLQPIQA